MKSNLYVLLSSLCEVYKGRNGFDRYRPGQVEVLHFSGVEMINYLVKNRKQAKPNERELNALFASVRDVFPGLLPEELVFRLVPTDMLGQLVSDEGERALKIEKLFSEHQKLVGLYAARQQGCGSSSGEIRSRILSLGDEAIKEEVSRLREGFDKLPGKFKKRVSQAEEMLKDLEGNRKKISGILVSTLIGIEEASSGNREEQQLAELRSGIFDLSQDIKDSDSGEMTQYDTIENGKRVCFPETAFGLSQKEIRETWNYSMNEAGKEARQEVKRR